MPTVQRDGVELHYRAYGAGEALVLAHGMGGSSLSWWQQVPHFSRRQRVIVFDHRGFGRSRCRDEQFQPGEFASDLCAILDAEGIERAALACQSMGGWTGLATALHHPERVRCLALCDTPAGIVTEEVAKSFARIAARLDSEGVTGGPALAPGFPEREPERALLYELISGLNPGLSPAALARLARVQVRAADLEGYAVPTLALAGAEDQLFSPAALREVAAAIPGAEWVELAGLGHSTYFEDPVRFNRTLDAFLARHP